MPQRKTKGVATRRAKPTLPDGNEGESLTQDERTQKLTIFLKDFHVKVEDKLKKMREDRNETISKVEVLFSSYMMQIPMEVLDMKITDFLACGGTIEKALDHQLNSSEDDVSEVLDSFLKKSAMKSSALRTHHCGGFEAISEENEEENVPPSTAQRSTRQRKGKVPTKATMAPPMSKARLRTPAPITLASAGWDTPLITPKFDPRLPRTPPGVRAPHVGERFVSLNGSPISVLKAGTKQTTISGIGMDIMYNIPDSFSVADMKKALSHMHSLLQDHVDRGENHKS